ncbi:unnamed protein product [Mucor fragilis]
MISHNQLQEIKKAINPSRWTIEEEMQDIKELHEENKRSIENRVHGYEEIKKLASMLAESADVKLSTRVSDAEDTRKLSPLIKTWSIVES